MSIMVVMEVQDTNDASDADVESEIESDAETEKLQGFSAMGDIISKLLEKQVATKAPILSKSKKSKKRKLELQEELSAKKERADEKKEEKERNHVLPTRSNAQKEILLKRIATKGVVKLFNAVSTHQKTMSEKMKSAKTESKKTRAVTETSTKSSFMDLLKPKAEPRQRLDDQQQIESNAQEEPKNWDVLRDDFMLGASMKDWDQSDEEIKDEKDSEKDVEEDSDD